MKKILLFASIMVAFLLSGTQLNAQVIFLVTDPPGVPGMAYEYATTNWGHNIDTIFVHEQLVLVDDGTVGDSLGCSPLINGAAIAGKIAVVYRGGCEFGVKALNAQNAGAVGVLIINNVPDPPISPGAGAQGANVTIPVMMIGAADGALLRPFIDAGTAIAMMGNKTGQFADDIGAYRKDIVNAHSWAIPSPIAQDSTQFIVPVGSWVFNYGQNAQSNVTLNATISFGGNIIYNQTSAAMTINPGDSVFVSLPEFAQASYSDGLYTLEYNYIAATDDYPNDNQRITHFWIQPHHYSKNRWDPTTLQPIRTSHIRTGTSGVDEFMWCTVLDHEDTGNLTAYGVSFSATAGTTLGSLGGIAVEVLLFEWTDVIVDTLFFNNVTPIASEFYDYLDNSLSGIFVTQMFANPVQLNNNTRYLTCVKLFDEDVFVGGDTGIEYETTDVEYNPSTTQIDDLSFIFPVRNTVGTTHTWFSGFTSGIVPAIILHTSPQGLIIGVDENTDAGSVIIPFPNPANDMINIPLSKTYNGNVTLNVFDIAGRSVKSEVVQMNNTNNFRFSTANLTNGMYHINLKFGDGSTATFPVVITK